MEQQYAEVVPAEVDAGLQASRARPDYNTVKKCLALYIACWFHLPFPLGALRSSESNLLFWCYAIPRTRLLIVE